MLLTRRKQPSKALLKDVGKSARRIAEESRSAAGTARSELGGLGAELRDQASETLTQARLATAARLAGVAEAVEPPGKRRGRRLRLVIPAVIGGIVLAKVAKLRREQADQLATEDTDHQAAAAASSAGPTRRPSTTQGTERDQGNGKARASKSGAQSSTSTR